MVFGWEIRSIYIHKKLKLIMTGVTIDLNSLIFIFYFESEVLTIVVTGNDGCHHITVLQCKTVILFCVYPEVILHI
jgi:hypothetical protein